LIHLIPIESKTHKISWPKIPGIVQHNGLRRSVSRKVSALLNLTYHHGNYAPYGKNAINFEKLSIATKIARFPLLVCTRGLVKANTRSMEQGVGVAVCNPILIFCDSFEC